MSTLTGSLCGLTEWSVNMSQHECSALIHSGNKSTSWGTHRLLQPLPLSIILTFAVVSVKTVTLSDVETVTEKVSFCSGRISSYIISEMLPDICPGWRTTSSLGGTSKSTPGVAVPCCTEYLSKQNEIFKQEQEAMCSLYLCLINISDYFGGKLYTVPKIQIDSWVYFSNSQN